MFKDIFNSWRNGLTWSKIALAVIVALLLSLAIVVAINPQKQFAKMRNSQRRNDASLIINAIYQYTIDNNGKLPAEIDDQPKEICKDKSNCDGMLDLSGIVAKKTNTAYVSSMPIDPKNVGDEKGTGYKVKKVGDRITVLAPLAEQGAVISTTR